MTAEVTPGNQIENGQEKDLIEHYLSFFRNSALAQGIDVDKLSRGQKIEFVLASFREAYEKTSKIRALHLATELETAPKEEAIMVNPATTLIIIIRPDGSEDVFKWGQEKKTMLAYFVGLTKAKTKRMQNPWITRRELSDASNNSYSRDQFLEHLLRPLAVAGLFEKSASGFRLKADPDAVLEAVTGSTGKYEIRASGFKDWLRNRGQSGILIDKHLLPIILSLHEICASSDAGAELDVPRLRDATGLGREQMYENLRVLEKIGILGREMHGGQYKVSDINLPLVAKIFSLNKEPIRISVSSVERKVHAIDSRLTQILNIQEEEQIEFPQVSWAAKGVQTKEPARDEKNPGVLNDFLTCEFSRVAIKSKNGGIVYMGNLPMPDSLTLAEVLGLLDVLGLGPKELGYLTPHLQKPTLAAALRSLEEAKGGFRESQLLSEVKARTLSLLFGEAIAHQELEAVGISDLMNMISEISGGDRISVPEQTAVVQEPQRSRQVKKEKKKEPSLDRKLLGIMNRGFAKEFASATSQIILPKGLLVPTVFFNIHRKLSIEAGRIPWETLVSLRLGERRGKDHHPVLSPAGALICALFLNGAIHSRVAATQKGEYDAVIKLATHTYHLLREKLQNPELSEKEQMYIEDCLSELKSGKLVCKCDECRKR